MKAPFLFWSEKTGLTAPTPRLSPYTPPVEAPAPAHPERLYITGSREDRAGQIIPAAALEGMERVRNCADLGTLKHERFSTQECVQNH